jgi:hypothetical protein
LLDESPSQIGLSEEEWNHHDKLTEKTTCCIIPRSRHSLGRPGYPPIITNMRPKVSHRWSGVKRLARRMFIDELPERESEEMQEFMFAHQLQMKFRYTHVWTENDVCCGTASARYIAPSPITGLEKSG